MSSFPRLSQRRWLLALAGALAFTIGDAVVRVGHIEAMSRQYGVMVDPPAADPASPTGYAGGCRSMLFPGGGLDTLHWVMQTQAMLAAGEGRIRHVDYDNAPAGREVHWASPFHWWLALLAELDHAWTGRPLGGAVEHAALYADPVLLALALLLVVPLTARRFGGTAAALMAGGMVLALPFYLFFMTAYADHHGLAETCALLTVLGLLAGGGGVVADEAARAAGPGAAFAAWLPDRKAARRWFALSAVAGGVGLWISAASQVPVLIGVGLGALGAAWCTRQPEAGGGWRPAPELWRWWGRVGAAASVAAYLVEYFPSHLGMRLEVNHPLYALAWLGGGELLCRIQQALVAGRVDRSPRAVGVWLGALAAVALLPAVILATGATTFIVGDPFVWHLHVQSIAEFESVRRFLGQESLSWPLVADVLPAVLILPALGLLRARSLPRAGQALLVLALVPTLLFYGLTLAQVRWWGIAYGLLFAVLAMQFTLLERGAAGRAGWWRAGCALVLLPGAINAVRSAALSGEISRSNLQALAERDAAQWLRLHAGREPVVVLSSPATTTPLIYYGGLRGLGTLYWENRAGLEHAAAIFAAPNPDAARALLRRYGVTHIVLMSWSPFNEDYVRLYLGLAPGQPLPPEAFILGLLHGQGIPPWLRPIPYPLPDNPALAGQSVLVFAVTPPAPPDLAAVHLADFLVEMGRLDLAARMEPQLGACPQSLPTLAMLAYLQGKAGEGAAFGATVDRILTAAPPGPDLAVEDRIRLAFVLAAAGQLNPARGQLAACLRDLDEPTLRHLTAGSLRDLLVLAERFELPIADPGLRRLAIELLPPMMRQGS